MTTGENEKSGRPCPSTASNHERDLRRQDVPELGRVRSVRLEMKNAIAEGVPAAGARGFSACAAGSAVPSAHEGDERALNDFRTVPATPARWKRPVYLLLVVAALATVMLVWFHTPEVRVTADSAGPKNVMLRCANAGPSRWDAPTVGRGQELADGTGPAMQYLNQQILKNDIESLRVDLACGQARAAHTNTLIVAIFAAGLVLFFGHSALWVRGARSEDAMRAA